MKSFFSHFSKQDKCSASVTSDKWELVQLQQYKDVHFKATLNRQIHLIEERQKGMGNNGAGFRRCRPVPVKRCGVTGHEEEDVWL